MIKKKLLWNAAILVIGVCAIVFWAQSLAVLAQKPEVSATEPAIAGLNPDTTNGTVEIPAETASLPVESKATRAKNKLKLAQAEAGKRILKVSADANRVVAEGLHRIGRPYIFGSSSERGFDCSGFVKFVFGKVGVEVPRSSELLAKAGIRVSRNHARRGDILIFTGTNSNLRSPGHVGIVISEPGEKLSFVHASSNGGVKISQVPGTKYERRFLEVRRVL